MRVRILLTPRARIQRLTFTPQACCAKLMPCWPLGTLAGPLGLGWPLGPPSSTLFICKHLCNLVTKQSKPVWLSSITREGQIFHFLRIKLISAATDICN